MNAPDLGQELSEGQVLSTRMTAPLRLLGLAIPVALVAFMAYGAGHGDTDASFFFGVAFASVPCLLVSWLLVSLATVQVRGNGLWVKTLTGKGTMPFARITYVSSCHFLAVFITTLPLVTVTYQGERGTRKRIRFVARLVMDAYVCGVHRYVVSLRAKSRPFTSR